ncbi:MAG: phosphate acyltransferase PlsX [Alphaproteobacteria bacterium GM7ARS4]|nr:phosphate acyltransferase PlsX [Alphaproteobacteria bacterium GM7ARS4]
MLTIALDAMGGDNAPDIVLEGVATALSRLPDVSFLLYGDEKRLRAVYGGDIAKETRLSMVHTPDVVSTEAKPSVALRQGRKTSMYQAIQAVKQGKASGVVSAGNTGALMAMGKVVLRMLPNITRPAIIALMPTMRGESLMLDLGANVHCDSDNLIQFAYMGDVYARHILGLETPVVGLLNVGSEETKGHEELRQAADILRHKESGIHFHGFVEGDDISRGTVHVVVSDGFSGNVALKTLEGGALLFKSYLEGMLRSSLISRMGYFFMMPALKRMKRRLDPRLYNGAMLVGLNGVVVKSHGGTDGFGFANAIEVACALLRDNYNEKLKSALDAHSASIESARHGVSQGHKDKDGA